MDKRKVNSYLKISVLDYYIIKELLPSLVFYIAICSILSELVGISFEQIKFVVEQNLPLKIVTLIHLLKLPSFIYKAFPFALLMATINVYSKLSSKNEIRALQSFGISLVRLILPSLAISSLISAAMFTVSESIVPSANYQAAMLLEQEWDIDRSNLAKYNNKNIIYQEFEQQSRRYSHSILPDDKQQGSLKLFLFAEYFDGKQMGEVTLIKYQNTKIKQIIIAHSAKWVEQQQQWRLFSGIVYKLNAQMKYSQINNFKYKYLKLTKNILDYVNNNRDPREMNILDLYQQLAITKHANDLKKIRQLKISIQERYAALVSCVIFAFLGSTLGMNLKTRTNANNLGIAAIIIFIYHSAQFLGNALAVTGIIAVFWGVWFPTLLNLYVGCFMLRLSKN